ncbi:MAG TPA: sialidase family protein [Bryobacteraceae bacterium]|nr:sialidase family protein [Bryobacteraceae bacterium]
MAIQIGPVAPVAPEHTPQLAAKGSMVALAFGAGDAIYCSVSHDGGKTFAPPVKVAEEGVFLLTHHRGPRVVVTGDAIVISAVGGKKAPAGQYPRGDLTVWRSVDGGKTWSKGTRVNDVPNASSEALHALASDGKGTVFAAWLDNRKGHGQQLYGARSMDGGVTWLKNVMIYDSPEGSICQCCHPSAAIDSQGRILVMFRNWMDGARDMYLTESRDGETFSKPVKLGMGSWHLNACPMDGGGLAVSREGAVTAWRRDHEIFLAKPGEREVELGTGSDVALSAGVGGVFAVWSKAGAIQALFPGENTSRNLAPHGTFPSVVALANGGALAAWENDGKIDIQPVR